jgi:hypothetical protein
MFQRVSFLRAWLELLVGIAIALLGGITVILILIMGTGARLSDFALGAVSGLWGIAVYAYLFWKMKKGNL